MSSMMVYGTKRIKGINMMLDALEQYYVNYNELQQITSQYELELRTQLRQMQPHQYSQVKHSLAKG